VKKTLALQTNLNLMLLPNKSVLCVYTAVSLKFLYMPSYYMYFIKNNKIHILLFKKSSAYSIFSTIKHLLNKFTCIYMIRLRLKGLGYRISTVSDHMYSFCFNSINYIYMFLPLQIFMRVYKKRFIIISKDWHLLKLVLVKLLGLKRMGPYVLRGLRLPRTIVPRKRGGKKTKF